jgi:hypothetical protein
MAEVQRAGPLGRLVYRPVALAGGLVAGALAAHLAQRVWTRIPIGGDTVPDAMAPDHPLREVLLPAALQGAIFAAVKVTVDRLTAQAFEDVTGTWPV